ncbi:MAG TPA: adenylate/guanylate cyclase domain-containing protein [Solirubrobacteraceae bacterium]|nr:adenylate/guanylate cyclase domain-containing protein [Solirubrobacteraceae bacterium]
MIDPPSTGYAEGEGFSLAYQVFGEGDLDLVFVSGGVSHVDIAWQDRRYARFMQRLGSFARVTVFDKRGMGASDPVSRPPTLAERTEDIRIVMDAAAVEKAALFGLSEGGTSTAAFAATFPQRTSALVLCGAFPGGSELTDLEPGYPREQMERFWERTVEWVERFGQGATIELFAPSLAGNERAVAAMAAFERATTTPAMFRAVVDSMHDYDMRPSLASISAPTLVLHRRDETTPVEGARYIARHIAGARLVELEGDDHLPWLGDMDALLDETQEFLTGARPARVERRVASVLFTDIVGSTERAAQLGDRRWRAVLEDHHDAMHSLVERFDGRLVKTIGDGTLSLFDGPAPALECAREAVREAAQQGVELRAGVHAGQCELIGDDVGGIAVHVGARVASIAGPGEVLVSSTVKELVAGSDLSFADRGVHELKGLPAEWQLYSLT